MRSLFFSVFWLLATPIVVAGQMIVATPSRNQLYAGAPFTIDLTITPPEAIKDLEVEPVGPNGFQITQTLSLPKKPTPSVLGPGGSYTAVYEITPPRKVHATTERYSIIFNVSYRHSSASENEPLMWQSLAIPFTVTFSREAFYFWGITGLFVGWFIKALGTFSAVVLSPTTTPPQEIRGLRVLLAFLSRREITSVLTSLAMGFLALLLLSRNQLPTGAIHDTLALGIGLGFLSDDQLLNRIKVVGERL